MANFCPLLLEVGWQTVEVEYFFKISASENGYPGKPLI
jgi:hypothetical protein